MIRSSESQIRLDQRVSRVRQERSFLPGAFLLDDSSSSILLDCTTRSLLPLKVSYKYLLDSTFPYLSTEAYLLQSNLILLFTRAAHYQITQVCILKPLLFRVSVTSVAPTFTSPRNHQTIPLRDRVAVLRAFIAPEKNSELTLPHLLKQPCSYPYHIH